MTTEQYRKRSGFSIFLSFFKPHRGLFFLDMACALVVSMIDLAYPIISRYAMRTLLPQSAYRTFFTIMLIVLAAYALRSVLYFIITYWGHTFGIRVEADIRAALFGHMQELGFEFFDRNRTGQLMSRMTTDLFEITELAHHGPEDLFISLVTIVGALTVMATIEWRLALVVAVMIPVFIAIIVSRRKAMREASRRVKKKTGAINADIESALSGIRTAKAFANEHVEEEKFDRSNDIYKTSKKMFHREMGIFMAVMEFFTSSLSVAVVTVGGLLIMKGQMDTVDLLTFTLYIASFVNPIRKLANFTELFSNGTAGFERFLEIMRTAPELHDAPDALELTHVRGEIGVENVSFSYEDDPEVLHDVSLHVPAGKTVAIVGPSGGGKSTLCQLIPRFYDVTGGSITAMTCAASRRSPCAAPSASCSRTCFCSPIPFWKTSATVSPARRWRRSWRRRSARKFTTISWPCPTALTPTSANAARSCPADRSSAFPSRAFSSKIRPSSSLTRRRAPLTR